MHRAFKGSTNLIPRRVRSSAADADGNSRGITNGSSLQEEYILEHKATTYVPQRCGSKGHGEDQGWGEGTLAQDKDQGQGASLFLLDHLQGLVLSTLRLASRFLTPARVSTIYASLLPDKRLSPAIGARKSACQVSLPGSAEKHSAKAKWTTYLLPSRDLLKGHA